MRGVMVRAWVLAAAAAAFYVDPSGSDSSDGSDGAPFQTLQRCVDELAASPGSCVLRAGRYRRGQGAAAGVQPPEVWRGRNFYNGVCDRSHQSTFSLRRLGICDAELLQIDRVNTGESIMRPAIAVSDASSASWHWLGTA